MHASTLTLLKPSETVLISELTKLKCLLTILRKNEIKIILAIISSFNCFNCPKARSVNRVPDFFCHTVLN